jgi:LysM repeat protein
VGCRRGPLGLALLVASLLSNLGAASAESGAAAASTHQVHLVESGETLSSIAAVHFGNPHLWPALYRANRDQIKDPSQLYPGQTLSIPATPSTAALRGAPTHRAERVAPADR